MNGIRKMPSRVPRAVPQVHTPSGSLWRTQSVAASCAIAVYSAGPSASLGWPENRLETKSERGAGFTLQSTELTHHPVWYVLGLESIDSDPFNLGQV